MDKTLKLEDKKTCLLGLHKQNLTKLKIHIILTAEGYDIEFKNNEGDKIRFFYHPENNITNISVDNENHEIDSCLVLGRKG